MNCHGVLIDTHTFCEDVCHVMNWLDISMGLCHQLLREDLLEPLAAFVAEHCTSLMPLLSNFVQCEDRGRGVWRGAGLEVRLAGRYEVIAPSCCG